MTRFWGVVIVILIIGLAAVVAATGQSNTVKVNDLETECRYDRTTETNIQLNQDNSLRFKGHFPVNNVNTELDYSYSSGGEIVLNIRSQRTSVPMDFWNDCLASTVYDIETPQIEPGTYPVEIKHNGERLERRIIRIKG